MHLATKMAPRRVFTAVLVLILSLMAAGPAFASPVVPSYTFAGALFGLDAAPDGSLLVADSGAGIVSLRSGKGSLVASLPGVADVAAIGVGDMFAITGGGDTPSSGKLFRVSNGSTRMIADLSAYEATVNPDGKEINSNPFDVAALTGGKALVADAGANDLLIVDQQGRIDWVATLPDELASTANLKSMVNCPDAPAGLGDFCDLPPMIPTEAVATSIAIGPDGAYYVGELKGFPGPVGLSKVWRIEPGTLHAKCGASPACKVVADGFTSIVDLSFGPDGTLYVVEMDEASFLAAELNEFGVHGKMLGGTVNACNSSTWACHVVAGGLTLPLAATVSKDGTLYATVNALMPNAQVVTLP